MNAYSESPFFFFVDPMFPVDAYQDAGKIVELSDTGCDAIFPSSSIGEKDDRNRSFPKKTLHHDGSSFRKAFDQKSETNREGLKNKRNAKRNVLPKDKTLSREQETKEFTKKGSKVVDREINEKIDQWERNIADFENTLLRDQRNLTNDSSWIENDIIDSDLIFVNFPIDSVNKKPNIKKKKEENETRRKMSHSYKNMNESKSITELSRSRNSTNELEEGNKKNRFSSASRSSQKEKENKPKIVADDVIRGNAKIRTDFPFVPNVKKKRNDKLKDFNEEIRKTIDRAVDKDSISNMSGNFEENIKNNVENLNKDNNKFGTKQQNIEKSKENVNRQRFNREMNKKTVSETRTISKSAGFDKSKHRVNMAKRYANKSWMKSSINNPTAPKIQEKESFPFKGEHFDNANNDNSRAKVVSKSAGTSSRRIEETQKKKMKSKEEINAVSSFNDNSDASSQSKRRNNNRISGNSLPRSARGEEEEEEGEEGENDKVSIQRKDIEKIGAIFLSSSLRKSGKLPNSKTTGYEDHNSKSNKSNRLEINKTKEGEIDRTLRSSKIHSPTSNLYPRVTDKIEKLVKSRIPIAISRLNKELEDNTDHFKLEDYNRSRSRLRSKSKSIVTETDRSNENTVVDVSTSTGIILIDKSDCTKDEDNETNDRVGTRSNSLSTKFEESRKRKMDVELKVLKIAKDVKEKRREEFEKCGLREPMKKLINESQEIVDIAVTILEKDSKGKTKSSNADSGHLKNEGGYSKPYSLRSGMYSKYLSNHFPFKRYRT